MAMARRVLRHRDISTASVNGLYLLNVEASRRGMGHGCRGVIGALLMIAGPPWSAETMELFSYGCF